MAKGKKLPPGEYEFDSVGMMVVTKDGWLELSFEVTAGDLKGRIVKARIPVAYGQQDESDIEEEEDEILLTEEKLLEDIKGALSEETRANLIAFYGAVMYTVIDENDVEWDQNRE